MQIPEQLIRSLEGVTGFDPQAFTDMHAFPEQVTSIRINPLKYLSSPGESSWMNEGSSAIEDIQYSAFIMQGPVPWSQYGYYLAQRPSFTFDPVFHAGAYYVQEASGMFLEQALKQTVDLSTPLKILDLCAAPGGKSTHLQSLISADSLLVSNDAIKSRANILKDNMIKWGGDNVVVTNNDPAHFGKLENYFDVLVIDAPCSGSGLFRRDEGAMDEWSLNNVALCSQRQQRILADVWPALKSGGVLIYSTCSYSKEEDEEIVDWINDHLEADNLRLTLDDSWKITETRSTSGAYGYRFWPYTLKGEGFFMACFRKGGAGGDFSLRVRNKLETVSKKEKEVIQQWVKKTDHQFIQHNNIIYALPAGLKDDINIALNALRVIYSGVIVGEMFGEKLAPGHPLAMSHLAQEHIPDLALDFGQAIKYLQRKDLNNEAKNIGWQLVKYNGFNLGWIKVLSNRINNYYPKELRILKDG